MRLRDLLIPLLVAAALFEPAVAQACSLAIGPPLVVPTADGARLPEGSFVVSEAPPVSDDGSPWTEDVKMSLARRPRRPPR